MTTQRSQRLMELREKAQQSMARMEPSAVQRAFESMDLPRLIEELRIYQEELEIQNEELAVAHTKADAARSHYQLLFNLLPMPAMVLEGFGVIVEDNDASQDWLGPPRRFQHHDLRLNHALARDDRPRLNRMLSLLEPLSKGALSNLSLTCFDQSERRVDLSTARLPQDFHQDARFLAVLLDRTAEKARLSEHGVFNALLDSNDDVTFATDPFGRLMLANQAFLSKLGLPRERALGRKLSELLPPAAAALDVPTQSDAVPQPPLNRYVSVHWPGESAPSALALHRFPILNRKKEVIGYASTCRDSTREQAEAGQEDLAHRALMELPMAVAVCNEQGQIRTVNQQFEERTGFSAEALHGRSLDRLFPPDSPESASEEIRKQLHGGNTWRGQRVLRRADGSLWPALISVRRMRSRPGQAGQAVVWVFSDSMA